LSAFSILHRNEGTIQQQHRSSILAAIGQVFTAPGLVVFRSDACKRITP
jgi:hypothetical protein